jgi:hypothetical protein
LTSRDQLSAIELLASFIVDSGGGAFICVRWPADGGEALVIFSDKKVHAGSECAVPLLGLCEETVHSELELNHYG